MEYIHDVNDRHVREPSVPNAALAALQRLDMNLLPLLQALLQHKNVTEAAAAVGLTQPAMSNALRRIRHTLNDELLVRVARRYELTSRAAGLVEPVDRILRAVADEVLAPPTFDPDTSQRTFTMAASGAATQTVLPRLAAMITTRAPGIRLDARMLDASSDEPLIDPAADVTLLPDVLPTLLPRERLYDEEWVCVVDAGNDAVGDKLTVEDLTALPHLVFQWLGTTVAPDRLLQEIAPDRVVQVTVFDFLLIPPTLRGTRMISVLQRRLADRVVGEGGLRVVEPPVPFPPLSVDLVWNPRHPHDPGCAWLREQLFAAVSSTL